MYFGSFIGKGQEMVARTKLAAVCALLDRARDHIPRAELPRLVMSDPGHFDYVAAYERVLASGLPALLEDSGNGLPLMGSFDITENLLLSHNDAGESVVHRWFSVLTACIELLGASDYHYSPFSLSVAALLVDSFALHAAKQPGEPLELLPPVFRELRQTRRNPHERVLALLGELLTATLTADETEAACRELAARHEDFQEWYAADGERNGSYARRPEFIWGAVVDKSELPTWLELVEGHFPSAPELARTTRERLLREGQGWLSGSTKE